MAKQIHSLVDLEDENTQRLWLEGLKDVINEFALYNYSGEGTPLNVVTAPIGSIYHRTDGGAGTSLYVKETEVSTPDSTGWVGK